MNKADPSTRCRSLEMTNLRFFGRTEASAPTAGEHKRDAEGVVPYGFRRADAFVRTYRVGAQILPPIGRYFRRHLSICVL